MGERCRALLYNSFSTGGLGDDVSQQLDRPGLDGRSLVDRAALQGRRVFQGPPSGGLGIQVSHSEVDSLSSTSRCL